MTYDCKGIFDSHAHYFDRRFAEETEGADVILENEVLYIYNKKCSNYSKH